MAAHHESVDASEMRQLTAREGGDGAILDRRRAGQPQLETAGNLSIQAILRQQLLRLHSFPTTRLCEVRVVRSRLLLRHSGSRRIPRQPPIGPPCGDQHAVALTDHRSRSVAQQAPWGTARAMRAANLTSSYILIVLTPTVETEIEPIGANDYEFNGHSAIRTMSVRGLVVVPGTR